AASGCCRRWSSATSTSRAAATRSELRAKPARPQRDAPEQQVEGEERKDDHREHERPQRAVARAPAAVARSREHLAERPLALALGPPPQTRRAALQLRWEQLVGVGDRDRGR